MIKNRCSPVSLVLFSAIGAFLICAVSAQGQQAPVPVQDSTGVEITTPEDSVVGTIRPMFEGTTADCVVEQGGFHKANCTANDVRLTAIVRNSLQVFSGAGCTSDKYCFDAAGLKTTRTCTGPLPAPGTRGTQGDCNVGETCLPTITFGATGQYIVGPQRYDIGLYIATDTDVNNDGARTGNCSRYDFPNNLTGQTDNLDGDTCGDVDPNTTPEVDFGKLGDPVTIPCIDLTGAAGVPDGKVDINHCETWANSGDGVCTGAVDVKAETSSKCFCGLLAGACIATPNADVCKVNSCALRCSNATGATDPACTSDATCTGGAICEDTLITTNAQNGTACGDQTTGDCKLPNTCQAGVCTTGIKAGTTTCRPVAGVCDVLESCDGINPGCPTDVFLTSGVCRASAGDCDVAESCNGTGANCPVDGFLPLTTTCRTPTSVCDKAESCSGHSATCGPDTCDGGVTN